MTNNTTPRKRSKRPPVTKFFFIFSELRGLLEKEPGTRYIFPRQTKKEQIRKEPSVADPMAQLDRCERRFASWEFAVPGFAGILRELLCSPPPARKEEGLINVSSGKYVWHLRRRNDDAEEFDFAWKTNPGKTPWRYILRPSLTTREARNYLRFAALGVPTPRVLAAGDIRVGFILKQCFIATAFVPGSDDGRAFMPGGARREETALKLEFCRKNLKLLAGIHDAGIFHKAFHPRNLLWRGGAGAVEVFWIDVARCRPVPARKLPRAVLVDLHVFFRDMRLRAAELAELAEFYLSCRKSGGYPGGRERLIADLYGFRRRRTSRKRYILTEEMA